MSIKRIIQSGLIIAAACVLWPVSQAAAHGTSGDLKAAITGSSLEPKLQLTNRSDHSCQVAKVAQGTVAVTKVMQDGKYIEPMAIDGAQDDDIGYLLESQLTMLKPGETIDLTVPVYTLSSGHVLRATTWSADAGALTTQYAINPDKPLQLEASYSLPVLSFEVEHPCGAAFASTIPGKDKGSLLMVGIALLVIVGSVVAVMFWLHRKRHAGKIAATAVVIALGLAGFANPQTAHADVTVPSDMQAAFNGCIDTFNANRDITGPVLDLFNDPAYHFEIVRTTGGSDMTGFDHTFTIYWNPDDRHPYAGTGGSADPCTSLYHELYHALDMRNGTFSRNDCGGSGIETKEVMATRAQNALRERLGMPPRSHYGDRALPTGDCSAPANPAQCVGDRCGDTNGDPHLRTFDGLRYDFQAVGEFIAARNQDGSYEIQVRQTPWEGSRIVSLNTALAFKIDTDTVELRSGTAIELFVNGKKETLEPKTLPGGGSIDVDQGVVVLMWKDSSVAYVRSVGSYGVALSVQPSEELAGKVEGILGDANGDSANDLHARGSDAKVEPVHNQLYPAFANSWRITDQTSLFTYDSGKNTASYTDRTMPDESPDPKTLPGYVAAEAFCKSFGISDDTVLANCALDVAITGRPEFARAATNSQIFAAGADFGGTSWQLSIPKPGDKASVTFEATAGEKVFVHVPQATLDSQCGGLLLHAPDGTQVGNGCIINHVGMIDGTVLPATGTYTLSLTSHTVGTATVRLLRITDKQGNITPDGASVTARIDQPGVVGRYTFTAQAGQRVYVDAPTSSLPSQCGVLRLFDPAGNELTSGCIINHVGNIDTKVLPETGTYTVVVDPNDTAIGFVTMRLIMATAETQAINIDGQTLTARLEKPGSIAQLTFNGVAGQRVFIDLPTSELPSQCGILQLRQPDGSTVGSGCIINGKGNLTDDGVVLPATGRYTIVLDPNDSATGATTVKLRGQ